MAGAAREVNITISTDVPDDMAAVYVDGEKIQRVIINLLDNALDYAETHILLKARFDAKAGMVKIDVNDDGPGIPLNLRDKVFMKFGQLDDAEDKQGKRRNKHSGIGLTYCKRAVEAHGGTIHIEDACDLPGACFQFTLPIAEPRPPAENT